MTFVKCLRGVPILRMTSPTTSDDARTVILPFRHGMLLHEKVRLYDETGPLSRSGNHPALSPIAASTTSDHMSEMVINARLALVCQGLSIKSALDIVPELESASSPSAEDPLRRPLSCRDSMSFKRHSAASARARSESMRSNNSLSRASLSSISCTKIQSAPKNSRGKMISAHSQQLLCVKV